MDAFKVILRLSSPDKCQIEYSDIMQKLGIDDRLRQLSIELPNRGSRTIDEERLFKTECKKMFVTIFLGPIF